MLRKELVSCPLGDLAITIYNNETVVVHARYNKKPSISNIKNSKKILQDLEDRLVLMGVQNYWVECQTETEIRFCSLFGFKPEFKRDGYIFMMKELF